jgi:hypothetical protein
MTIIMTSKLLSVFILLLGFFSTVGIKAQNVSDTTKNPFDDVLERSRMKERKKKGIEFGVSILNVGMTNFAGTIRKDITPGLSINPSINVCYRRLYLFFDLVPTFHGKTKTNFYESDTEKELSYEMHGSMASLGYSISYVNGMITPYIGPSWNTLNIHNNPDDVFKSFRSSGFIYGIKFILKMESGKNIEFISNKLERQPFNEMFFNVSVQPLKYNENLKGTMLSFHIGFYFNQRLLKKRK